jgi:phage-related holin
MTTTSGNFMPTITSIVSLCKQKAFFSAILTYFAYLLGYDYTILHAVFILVVVDFITGVARGYFIKQNLQSHLLFRTGYKMMIYLLLIIVAHVALTVQFMPAWTDDFIEFLIALTELKSIMENAGDLGFYPAKRINDILTGLENKKFDEVTVLLNDDKK